MKWGCQRASTFQVNTPPPSLQLETQPQVSSFHSYRLLCLTCCKFSAFWLVSHVWSNFKETFRRKTTNRELRFLNPVVLHYKKGATWFMGLEPLTMWLCAGEVMPKMSVKNGKCCIWTFFFVIKEALGGAAVEYSPVCGQIWIWKKNNWPTLLLHSSSPPVSPFIFLPEKWPEVQIPTL